VTTSGLLESNVVEKGERETRKASESVGTDLEGRVAKKHGKFQ